ncbi:FtsB family cell division protein [Microaceticoccus formicicus]|uniref:FtsB family cell division protein n=1 Tax=Microaceticoccus formicicus TaxID=3118105 RepID=UPI003CD02116|nr:septum formation initiator family protein [Peptoniphilaceae bacterium AMB_02]
MKGKKTSKKATIKNANKRFLIFISAVVLIFATYFIYTLTEQSMRMTGINAEIERKKAELEEINNEIKILEEELTMVDEPEFIERIAREKLKMVSPKDIIYVDSNKPDRTEEQKLNNKR